jgi:hypothetical protein
MEEQTSTAVTTRSSGVRYGVMLGAVSIVIFFALTFAGVDQTSGIGRWASVPIYIALIYMAQKYFKDEGDGFMSYGQGVSISFWAGLISTVIYTPIFYIYIKFIDGGFVEAIKNKQIEEMQNKGMSDEQIDQAMSFAGAFMSPEAMLVMGFFGGIIFILICGLIVTIFTQKTNPQPSI